MNSSNQAEMLETYLQSLDVEALNLVLSKVLAELRVREKSQLQVDFITRSKRLGLGKKY